MLLSQAALAGRQGGVLRGAHLAVAAILDVLLPVEEPVGDLELAGVLDDGKNTLLLILSELSGSENHKKGGN